MKNKYFFLAIAVFFGILAGILTYLYQNTEVNNQEQSVQTIQRNIQKELYYLEAEIHNLSEKLQKTQDFNFTSLQNQNSKHHFFIYNQKKDLLYWSDYRYIPNYKQLKGNYRFKFIENKAGSFVILKSKLSHQKQYLETFALVPVYQKYKRRNAYLKSGYNPLIIDNLSIEISQHPSKKNQNIYASSNEFLFSVKAQENTELKNETILVLSYLSLLSCFIFVYIFLSFFLYKYVKVGKHSIAFLMLFIFLVVLRLLFLYLKVPQTLLPWEIFQNPTLYASSWLAPSMGDLLLNLIFIWLLLFYWLRYYSKTKFYKSLYKYSYKKILAILFIFGIYQFIFLYLRQLHQIYLHSQVNLNISKTFSFDSLTLAYFLAFLLLSSFLFFVIHLLTRFFLKSTEELPIKQKIFLLVLGTILYALVGFFLGSWLLVTIIVGLVYGSIIIFAELPKKLYHFQYISSIYLFIGAILGAVLGTYALYDFGENKDLQSKRSFANYLSEEKDAFAEPQLEDALKEIHKDSLIQGSFEIDTVTLDNAENKIREDYLGSYFNRYKKNIHFFDTLGKALLPNSENLSFYEKNYKKIKYGTDNPNIYLINELGVNPLKNYFLFIEVLKNYNTLGYIVIELKQEKQIPNNVYPILLVDETPAIDPEAQNYSYAVYEDAKIRYASGAFNYERDFDPKLFENTNIFLNKGLSKNAYHHLALRGTDTKIVVVTSKEMDWWDVFSNFSLLFVLGSLLITIFIVIYSVIQKIKGAKITFATRIQIYMNLAFFIPLLFISIATLSITQSVYKKEFNTNFSQKTENIALNAVKYLEDYKEKKINKKDLSKELAVLAQTVGIDVNIFDLQGKYLVSNQPYIFEKDKILSQYINPKAYATIVEQKNKSVLLPESIGNLAYNSVYVPMKSYKTGDFMGILSVPFFTSQSDLERKMLDILSIILNMFTTIFIFFVLFSYFASRVLTVPLRMITAQIKKTDFQNYEHKLDWNSNDEIGLFVKEYNKMLKKLENSQDQLARTQKETAWREMAKQVAHEIKNPLTPMKLTLQHMQVRLNGQTERVQKLFERSFEMLLNQIETLDDIATSFSAFAKMPIPQTEVFDISQNFRKTEDLYKDYENVKVSTDITEGVFRVRGDQKLMGRIFTNLVKNAIEAMPEDRNPEIDLKLKQETDGIVRVEVHDNGAGIPKNIQEKIFMPNFTTKGTGSGIGLSVAKRGIEHAGGRIWFETSEDLGTSFFIELPLVEE